MFPLRSALLLVFGSLCAFAAQAQPVPSSDTPAPGWTCGYVVSASDLWLARCYDVDALVAYVPGVDDETQKLVWDVPLWGPPMSDERTVELVKSVLCGASRSTCNVSISEPAYG